MANVLVVEDDPVTGQLVTESLSDKGYSVNWAQTGLTAREMLLLREYDLVVLDWELPELSGIDLLKLIRDRSLACMVLILTARTDIKHKEVGFGAGADDYLTKPFDVRELLLRSDTLLRRPRTYQGPVLRIGNLVLDPQRHQVECAGNPIILQPREFTLLEFLMRHPNRVFTLDALIANVWDYDAETTELSVRVVVARLRKKLGNCSPIRTIYGGGYKLVEE